LEEAKKLTAQDVLKAIGDKIPMVKMHCSILAQNALKKAIENYQNKE
ncbi:MAG: iron-sulfur cluster assembly scaffold protein, partial [Candidatus Micrarchaeota archaeon]